LGPIDHLGTSECSAQGPAPPGRFRQRARKRTRPTRQPPARWWATEPTVSFASRYSFA